MAYKIVQDSAGWQPIGTISTTKLHNLGKEVDVVDPDLGAGKAVYVSFKISTVVAEIV